MTSEPAPPTLVPTSPTPASGTIRLRVRYCECDPMGVVHHASFIPWLEMARTELLRTTGVTYADMERAGFFLVITKLECRYRRPGRYDDLVEVRTRVVGGSGVKILHEYEVFAVERSAAGAGEPPTEMPQLLVAASTTLACVGRDGKIRELPGFLVAPPAA
ncbi:MAG: acyl-CoA thioesterase [Phycisphaerales bacterium]